MRITKEFEFDAAHRLCMVSTDHPCRSLHGHRYKVTVELHMDDDKFLQSLDVKANLEEGIDYKTMVFDYRDLKPIKAWLDRYCDHALLVAEPDKQLKELIKIDNKTSFPIIKKYTVFPIVETTAELLSLHFRNVFTKAIGLNKKAKKELGLSLSVTVQESPKSSASTYF